jgi:hypothetical protein
MAKEKRNVVTGSDTFPWSFPLQFHMAWGPCPPGEDCSETKAFFFLVDILFWCTLNGFLVSRVARDKV